MSDVENDNSKIYNKMTDVGVSSHNSFLRNEIMVSRKLEENHDNNDKKEIFDSGISLESNFSSGILSGTDLQYTSSADYNDKLNISNEELIKNKEEFSYTDSETKNSMRLDSGIDIDVFDQFSFSDSSSSVKKNENLEKDFSGSKLLPNKNLDELFFKQDEDGDTYLHLAILCGNEKVIKNILLQFTDSSYLNIRNYYRQTCLHLSVMLNQPEITRLLLLAGAKTGIEDMNGNTALHLACKANYFECVKALLDPLTIYEQKRFVFKFKPTIDSPSKYLNEYNYDGLSCIHIAAGHDDFKILDYLLIYGADINIRECKAGYTILHEAVISGNFELVNHILQYSEIDLERKNYARLTPYQLSKCPSVGKILLDKGASRLFQMEDESEDDYSTDEESENEEDNYIRNLLDYIQMEKVSDMINSLSTNSKIVNQTHLKH